MFDQTDYWLKRKEIEEFRKSWYDWRAKAEELYGRTFLFANPHAFSQRAFREFLVLALEDERKREAEGVQLEAPSLEVPEPLLSKVEIVNTIETPIDPLPSSSVSISDI